METLARLSGTFGSSKVAKLNDGLPKFPGYQQRGQTGFRKRRGRLMYTSELHLSTGVLLFSFCLLTYLSFTWGLLNARC